MRVNLSRFHSTVEYGRLGFKDDEAVFSTERMTGNRGGLPVLGQNLLLEDGRQFYFVRGEGDFATLQFTANPWDWLDLTGFLVRTKPSSSSSFSQQQVGTGLLTAPSILFFARGTDQFFGNARMPRLSWSGSAEARPFRRLRIRQIFETDRMKNDTSGVLNLLLLPVNSTQLTTITTPYADRLEVNQSRQQVEGLYDLARGIVARGGYRYEFGRSTVRGGNLNSFPLERAEMERHVGLAGLLVRPVSRLMINADLEVGNGVQTYYRTGLYDTVRFRAQTRLNLPKDLVLGGVYFRMNNRNPNTGIDYDYAAQTANASLQWLPKGGRNFSLLADYTRSAIRSDILYLAPHIVQSERSLYRDNAHTGTLLADFALPFRDTYKGRLSLGGSFVRTAGSRPSQFYQPLGRLSVPFANKVDVFVDWRWWGLAQPFYLYEGFRTHAVTTGLRFNL